MAPPSRPQATNFVSQNKVLLLALLAAIVSALLGYGVYSYRRAENWNLYENQLFSFFEKEFQKETPSPKALFEHYKHLTNPMGHYPPLVWHHLRMADKLVDLKAADLARELLKKGLDTVATGPTPVYFYTLRLATLEENRGHYDAAISALETLLKGPVRFLEGKIYLDLGRLQRLKGDLQKAKASFQWVVDKSQEKEFQKMATLYLSELP